MKEIIRTMNPKKMMKLCGSSVGKFVKAHQASVLTGSTIAFNVAGIVATYRNSPKIHLVIEECRKDLEWYENVDGITEEELKRARKDRIIQTLKDLAPLVAPILIFFTGSTAAAIINQKKSEAKIAALTAALSLAKTTIDEYGIFEEKVKEEIGEEKYQEVKEEIVREKVENTIPDVASVPMGEYLCYIPDFDIYFTGTEPMIRLAMERVNTILSENGMNGHSYGYESNEGNELVFVSDLIDELEKLSSGTIRNPMMYKDFGWDAGYTKGIAYDVKAGKTATGVPYLTLIFYEKYGGAKFINEY